MPRPIVDPTAEKIDGILRNWRILAPIGAALVVVPVALIWLVHPWLRPVLQSQFIFSIVVMAISLFIIIHLCAACILAERKISAFMQDRFGPNRVGFWGLLQPIADGVKFILKEDVIPAHVDRPIYILAPCIAFIVALMGFLVIPWAGEIVWPWQGPAGETFHVATQALSVDIGLLYMLGIGAMSVYGVVLAGWASNSKYSFYGGFRATAQMISYEIPLGLGLLTVLLVAGSLRLEDIVHQQAATGMWLVFVHPLAALLVIIAAFAETNRAPFDLAECEQELVGGYHTEYSSMKFALFFLAEYAHMIVGSALIVAVFFGGWAPLPFSSWYSTDPATGLTAHTWWNTGWIAALIKFGIFWTKVLLFLAFYMVIRWTLPRFRFDQLMRIAWKGLVPLGIVVVIAQGVATGLGWRLDPRDGLARNLLMAAIMFAVNAVIFVGVLRFLARSRAPVTGRQEDLPEVDVLPPAANTRRKEAAYAR